MCQNQKTLLAKINTQLSLVLSLAQDLKHDLGSIYVRIKRFHPKLLIIVGIMESELSEITPFDDEDTEHCQFQTNWEKNFQSKTYYEIIGINQPNKENLSLNSDFNYLHAQQNSSQLPSQALKRGPYRSYMTQEKLNVVMLFRAGKSYAFISRTLGIPQKNIVRWCKNGVHRKQGAGRKIGDAEMENKVIQWIEKSYLQGEEITGRSIRNKAMELSTKKQFKSSKGWLKNFVRRHNINIRYGII